MKKKIKGAGGGGGKGGGSGSGRVAQESPDSLRSIAYAQVLDLVCEGEIEGLANGLKSVYFNDTPLVNDNDTPNFSNASVTLVTGTQSQSHIAGFAAVENENIVNIQVEQSTPATRQISNPDVDAVRVRISIPVLTSQNMSNGDINGTSVQYAVDIQSNGGGFVPQILGSTWDQAKVTIASNTSAVANTAVYKLQISVLNAVGGKDFTVQYKQQSSSTWLTTGISVADSQITEEYYDQEYGYTSASIPVKTYTMPTQESGLWEMRVLITGTNPELSDPYINSATANYGTPYATVSGKTTSKYERSHRIELTGEAPWDVRVRRITADSTASALQNKTYFEAYTEIIDGKFRYPNSAIVGIRIDASQFNNIPKRSYDLKLLKVKIPSNYDPIAKTYTGIWDGTFKVAWTDNPAWCFYDLITNARYGLGEFIPEAQVDKWTLYAIGQYCDQLVDDGQGGTEPRYTCNIYLQNRQEAYTVVNNMASVFKGMPYWSSGSLTLGYDAPADPVYQFTNSNVIDGKFEYAGSSLKARHTVALVTWNDPSDNYLQKVEYVEDAAGIERYGVIQAEVVAVGCTSRGQANRVGRWLLFTERSETEMVTFKSGLEGNQIRPSNIIQVADEMRAGVRRGGRITAATTLSVTIDQDLSEVSGLIGSTISVILPNGALETRVIEDVNDKEIFIINSFSDAPLQDAIWVVQTTTVNAQLFRVISVLEEEDGLTVTALEHNPDKYDEIEDGVLLADRQITLLSAVPEAPANLTATESLFTTGSDTSVKVTLSWERVIGATAYEVSYRINENNTVLLPLTKDLSVDFPVAVEGVWYFKVFAINSIGKRSVPAVLTQTIDGKAGLYEVSPPLDLEAVSQSVIAADGTVQTGIVLTWTAPLENFVNEYEVQWTRGAGNYDWGSVSDPAVNNVNYGFVNATETFRLDYGSILDPVPSAEGGFNSRFTSQTYFTIQPVDTDIEYTIRVRAINDIAVKSAFTTIAYTSYGDVTPPALAENISIVSGYKQLIIKWTNPADSDFDYIEIYRNVINNVVSAQRVGNIRGSSFVDTGLNINTTYYYWLRSVDRSGNKSDHTAMTAGTTAFIDSDQFSQEVMNLFSEAGAYGIEPVATLPAIGDFDGQIKYDTTINKLYRWDAATSSWTDDIFSITAGSVNIASFASGIEPVGIVDTLPNPTGYTGAKIVFLTTDNKIYRYTGTTWTRSILTSDLDGELEADNFSASLRPVEIVTSLPTLDNFVGRTAVLTTDGKLYRYTTIGWTAAVNSTDISGAITNAQIEGLAASKVTGQLTNAQLEEIAAAKVSGQLTNAQLADIAAAKVTGTLTNAQIADVAATKLTGQITGTQITDNAISAPKISAGSITTAKLAAGAVTADTIAANAITSEKITAGAIVTGKIAAGAISANEIATNAITAEKVSAGSITAAKIAADAITSDKIAANAITAAKIEAGAITTAKLAAGAVTATNIAADTITSDKIAANAITASELAADAVTAGKIVAGAVSADKIAADAITAEKIAAGAVTASELAAGSVIAGKIAAGAVSTTELAADSISADKIKAGAIIAEKIAAGSIQTDKIAANAITGGLIAAAGVITSVAQIGDGLITNAKIANLAVDAAKITDGAITNAKIQNASITSAKIGDAEVDTIKIAGNSISRSYYAQGGNSASTGLVPIFGRVHITAMFYANELYNRAVYVYRDGVPISAVSGVLGLYVLTIVDQPAAGNHTYTAASNGMNVVLLQILDIQR